MFYILSPFKPTPKLIVQGTPEYMLGSWNANTGPTLANVISDSATGTVATVTLQLLAGNIPTTNGLITIVGTANSAGGFNVVNAPILSVTAAQNPDTGIYSVTFTSAVAAQVKTNDGGQAQVPQPELGDILTPAIVAALPISSAPIVSPVAGPNSLGKSISVTVTLPAATAGTPSTLAGVTVVLQGANFDLDGKYNTVATIATTIAAGTSVEWQSGQGDTATGTLAAGSVELINFRFYRVQVTAATGTGPIVCAMLQ